MDIADIHAKFVTAAIDTEASERIWEKARAMLEASPWPQMIAAAQDSEGDESC